MRVANVAQYLLQIRQGKQIVELNQFDDMRFMG